MFFSVELLNANIPLESVTATTFFCTDMLTPAIAFAPSLLCTLPLKINWAFTFKLKNIQSKAVKIKVLMRMAFNKKFRNMFQN